MNIYIKFKNTLKKESRPKYKKMYLLVMLFLVDSTGVNELASVLDSDLVGFEYIRILL